jgi:hypothetical protein
MSEAFKYLLNLGTGIRADRVELVNFVPGVKWYRVSLDTQEKGKKTTIWWKPMVDVVLGIVDRGQW